MNLTPLNRPIALHRGTKVTFAFQLLQTADGPPVDLTGSSFSGQIRKSYKDSSNLKIDLVFDIPTPETGEFSFTIDDTAFDLIPAALTAGVYDVLWTCSDGTKPKIFFGEVTINGTATKPA